MNAADIERAGGETNILGSQLGIELAYALGSSMSLGLDELETQNMGSPY